MDIIERVRPRICFFLCILKEEGQREKAIEYVNIYIYIYNKISELEYTYGAMHVLYYSIQSQCKRGTLIGRKHV